MGREEREIWGQKEANQALGQDVDWQLCYNLVVLVIFVIININSFIQFGWGVLESITVVIR